MKKMVLLTLLALSTPSLADVFQPDHYCIKPYKPFQFSSQWELNTFNDAVQQYKICIAEFVEEQEDAIRNHRMAAEDAIDEWNMFVQLEMN